jgi:hypothetical protein
MEGRRGARFALRRTIGLVELTRVGQALLKALVERGRVDLSPLRARLTARMPAAKSSLQEILKARGS